MEAKMKKYRALTGNGAPICSVGAYGIESAKDEIVRQLRRPGRQDGYSQWKAGGFRTELVEE